ncbi:MAG: T9SS type A sorting domain-containing protein [Balneolaceae bacterium]|nr:T9SS type A sorting domain-containing protein [Balneolaceae bacterium]
MKTTKNARIIALAFVWLTTMTGLQTVEAQRYVEIESDNLIQAVVNNMVETIDEDQGERDAAFADGTQTIYKLECEGTYWNIGSIENEGWHLWIEGPDPAECDQPPLVRPAVDDFGGSERLFRPRDNFTIKNVYLSHMTEAQAKERNVIRMTADNIRVLVDRLWMDWDGQSFYRFDNQGITLHVTNTQHRNLGDESSAGNGRWFDTRGNQVDTVTINNSTFYNTVARTIRTDGGVTNYLELNHVTSVWGNGMELGRVLDAQITNNIFQFHRFRGTGGIRSPGSPLIEVDSINTVPRDPTDLDAGYLEESDRSIVISNNNMTFGGHNQEFYDFFESLPDTIAVQWDYDGMIQLDPNDPTAEYIRGETHRVDPPELDINMSLSLRDDEEPWVVWENNIREVIDYTDMPDSPFDWFEQNVLNPDANDKIPFQDRAEEAYNPDFSDPRLGIHLEDWRNLTYGSEYESYTNSGAFHGKEAGFPLGDLNHHPEHLARWEAGETPTSTEIQTFHPDRIKLISNYPNPFNPTTNIIYEMDRMAEVVLSVYNVLGQRVRVMDLGTMPAGQHEVTLDASGLSSGVYTVQMQVDNHVQSMQISLIK